MPTGFSQSRHIPGQIAKLGVTRKIKRKRAFIARRLIDQISPCIWADAAEYDVVAVCV
jgi:hypothetical protein